MVQPQRHDETEAPRIPGSGMSRHGRLVGESEAEWRDRERRERTEAHIARSKTRRGIDILFITLYASLGASVATHLMGTTDLLGALWWLPAIARIPAGFVWRPDPDFWVLGSVTILKLDLFAILLYALVHSFLIGFHRAVTYQRVYIPQ